MQIEDCCGRERSLGLEKQHKLVVRVDSVAVLPKVKRLQIPNHERPRDMQDKQNMGQRQCINVTDAYLKGPFGRQATFQDPTLRTGCQIL